MIEIKLTPYEVNNLKIFLNRVPLKGSEAKEFVVIMQKILSAEIKNSTRKEE